MKLEGGGLGEARAAPGAFGGDWLSDYLLDPWPTGAGIYLRTGKVSVGGTWGERLGSDETWETRFHPGRGRQSLPLAQRRGRGGAGNPAFREQMERGVTAAALCVPVGLSRAGQLQV